MKCEDLLHLLNDYIDGEIDPGICEEFRDHLDGCSPCNVVVDTIRKSIRLYRENGEECEIPLRFQTQLHQTLREKWNHLHPRPAED